MKRWTVYKHISPSGKVYVGVSSNIKNRWAGNGYYYCNSDTIFRRALYKYGWNNFQHIVILENISKAEALYAEKYLIRWYKMHNLSYNITNGGEGTSCKQTQEHIKKRLLSRSAKCHINYLVIDKSFNYIVCETQKEAALYLGGTQANIAHTLCRPIGYTFKKHYIWKHDKNTPIDIVKIREDIENALSVRKEKMSKLTKSREKELVTASKKERANLSLEERRARYGVNHNSGWKHSDETKTKMSFAAKGRDMTKAVRASADKKSKPVVQMLCSLVINTFNSISEAARHTGINISNIAMCANGKRKTAKGFNWKFKEELEVCNAE